MTIKDEDVARLDQRRLYEIYTNWPAYFKDATGSPDVVSLSHAPSYYEALILCGMGGSATSSDILQEIMNSYGSIPTTTLRNEKMPSYVNSKSLVIVNSVSGNTLESLMMMKDAVDHRAEVISISSGGKLIEESIRSNSKYIEIPSVSVPRASLPFLLIPSLKIIDPFLNKSLANQIANLPEKINRILKDNRLDIPEESNKAKRIAGFLGDGFPFCYCSPALISAATRFKDSLNENSKIHCIRDSILEASHNDIVPFTYDQSVQNPKILHLRWDQDSSVIKERFDKVQSLFEKVVHPVMEVCITERDLITALISAIYLLDLSTIYAAISKNTDPSPTPAIHILKDT